jgi:hypothetical protein
MSSGMLSTNVQTVKPPVGALRWRDRAVVMGGGMAGLATARVLSDHYREVILVERDRLRIGPEQRRGVPQGGHAHGILAGGRNALEKLFPGISKDLLSGGALCSICFCRRLLLSRKQLRSPNKLARTRSVTGEEET